MQASIYSYQTLARFVGQMRVPGAAAYDKANKVPGCATMIASPT